MRDNLDLAAQAAHITRLRRNDRLHWLRIAIAALLLALITAGILQNRFSRQPDYQTLYRWRAGEWATIPLDLAGYMTGFYAPSVMTEDGSVWLPLSDMNTIEGALLRIQDGAAQRYGRDEGMTMPYIYLLAAQGNRLWGVSESDAFSFDGQQWINYPALFGDDDFPISIAASADTVMIVGYSNLARFSDGEWQTSALVASLPRYYDMTRNPDYYYEDSYVQMLGSAASGIWLALGQGIWHYSAADGWRLAADIAALDFPYSVWLLHADHDGLWFIGDEERLTRIDQEGNVTAKIALPQSKQDIYPIALDTDEDGETLHIATSSAIYRYDGAAWQEIAQLPNSDSEETVYAGATAFLPDGSILTALYYPERFSALLTGTTRQFVAFPLLIVVAIALDFLLRFMPDWRRQRERAPETHAILAQVMPSLAEIHGGKVANAFTGGRLFSTWFIQAIWIGAACYGFSWTVQQLLGARAYSNEGQIGTLLFGYLAAVLLLHGDLMTLASPALTAPIRLFMQGKYDTLLTISNYGSASGAGNTANRFWQIIALLALGRYDDVQPLLGKMIGEAWIWSNSDLASFGLNNLGYSFLQARLYNDAVKSFSAGAKLSPANIDGYLGIITASWHQQRNAERALEVADALLLLLKHRPPAFMRLKRYAWCVGWMGLALAAEMNGQAQAADAWLAKAIADAPGKFSTLHATLAETAAEIAARRGDYDSARAHYRRAAALDPQGTVAQRAQAWLAAPSTAGV
jgi:tetratricopeptide (TPR) repeat protein